MDIQLPQPDIQCSKCNSLNHFLEYTVDEDIFNLEFDTKVTYRICKTCNHKAEVSRIISTKGPTIYIETKPYSPNPIKF